ncbi:MAG: GerMN domain-containing protein [Firmicutes bacterium]|nr:GerMN domain-containing protein [Bacillota bacterium]
MRMFKKFIIWLVILAAFIGAYSLYLLYKQEATTSTVKIYLIESTPTEFFLIPINRQVEGKSSPRSALQALLDGPLDHEELSASVPKTTKLLDLAIQDKLASVSFSSEIRDDFLGGSLIEAYLVEAIVNTLTEFPEVEAVQILVEGEVVESIGGHIYIKEPLRRSN